MKRVLPILCLFLLLLIGGCSTEKVEQVQETGTAMGTIISQTLYVTDFAAAEGEESSPTAEIWELLDELERTISWRISGSSVAQINETAGKAEGMLLPQQLQAIFPLLWEIAEESKGAFDPTIAPLSWLWNLDAQALTGEAILPTEEEIAKALSQVDYKQVTFGEETIFLPEGFALDFGAVGKGMAVDCILTYLEEDSRIKGAVFSLGGNILTYGEKPDHTPWRVSVVDPVQTDTYLGVLELQGQWVVTTSGDYERYVELDGVRYHHLLDPATGYPADSGVRSVTILSKSGLLGDALSTACFVLGAEKGIELAEQYQVEILVVTDQGEILLSDGMEEVFHLISR